ncbi:muscleblind-like protein 1 isoform X32 [Drosophila subpulchrella]|uniref:muscleblind-like protein 1 isoform X32 n=1 Tax=Drosophila subpulchrella TaxID=1486046 RepID=UPI0018A17146|nr:muscleblind-like protein 1 isoform X32 [Drosophila subpulchrella]
MANVVNMNSLLNGKDSRWLQLEVCREFQRNKCSRQDTECKFAHPPANVEVQNGKVTACYDSIKATQLLDMDNFKVNYTLHSELYRQKIPKLSAFGRCNRDKPPCKYFHPPQHLKDQLLINGRNHLALKNALMQQMGIAPGQPVISGQVPTVATNPYLTGIPANSYSPYYTTGHLVPTLLGPDPSAVASQLGPVVPQTVQVAQQKIPRSDRLEVCREFLRGACKRAESECRFAHPQETVARHDDGSITVCMDAVKGRCARDPCRYFHPPLHLQAQLKAAQTRATAVAAAAAQFSGMVPFKRPAAEKSGIPVYQPGATAYQQLMQPYVPVSSQPERGLLYTQCPMLVNGTFYIIRYAAVESI